MAKKHSDLIQWQGLLPNPPYHYVPHSATIRANDGTIIASVGGDLKLNEIWAAGEMLAHCATRLPALIAATEAVSEAIMHIPSSLLAEHVSFDVFDEFNDQISMAKAEHLVDGLADETAPKMPDMSDVLREGEEAKRLLREIRDELQGVGNWTDKLSIIMKAAEAIIGPIPPPNPEKSLSLIHGIASNSGLSPTERLKLIMETSVKWITAD